MDYEPILVRDIYEEYAGDFPQLVFRPLIPRAVAEWMVEQHRIEDGRALLEDRQTRESVAIGNPWAEHALMVSGR